MKKLSLFLLIITIILASCNLPDSNSTPTSSSGVTQASTKVQTDLNGNTVEQNNIINRLKQDNTPGSIKHLYVISAMSGQVLIYSTVKGKVTSSGKRLNPYSVAVTSGQYDAHDGMDIYIAGNKYETGEVLQDDGTYGSSVDYIYWWDSKGVYHQLYITGGEIVTISNEPLAVKNIIMNMEVTNDK